MNTNCSNCRYCDNQPDPNNIGSPNLFCRRYPPVMLPTAGGAMVTFVQVQANMVCGEHSPEPAIMQLQRELEQ